MNSLKLTAKETKKLAKALELLNKAETLIEEVIKSNENYRYSGNRNICDNSLTRVISVLNGDINE